MQDLEALAARTQQVYDQHGAGFDRDRPKDLHERVWLDRFVSLLPSGGSVLDLGCGAGEPIGGFFIDQGFALTGVDFSRTMLALARSRFPQANWHQCDMCELDLGQRFDGIIGWNSFFHLRAEQQRATLSRIAEHLAPEGALMLTVGPQAGEVVGQVDGEPVYHASLSPDDYTAILHRYGIMVREFVLADPDCDLQTVLLGQRRLSPAVLASP